MAIGAAHHGGVIVLVVAVAQAAMRTASFREAQGALLSERASSRPRFVPLAGRDPQPSPAQSGGFMKKRIDLRDHGPAAGPQVAGFLCLDLAQLLALGLGWAASSRDRTPWRAKKFFRDRNQGIERAGARAPR
jgi:hypothetical protein